MHEATFLDEELDRARDTRHSTAREAAEIARDAGVVLLALTHLSTRYPPRLVKAEARAVFAASHAPRDLDLVEIPFRERGAPTIVRGGAAAVEPA